MKLRRNQRLLSLLTAVILLVCGMCLDLHQADSVLACSSYSAASGFSQSLTSEKLPERDSFISEGRCQGASLHEAKPVRHLRGRACSRSDFPPLSPEILLGNTGLIFCAAAQDSHPDTCTTAVILHYIHMQDGQKS